MWLLRSFREGRVQVSIGAFKGPVSDHVLINGGSKERALHQAIKYSHGAI